MLLRVVFLGWFLYFIGNAEYAGAAESNSPPLPATDLKPELADYQQHSQHWEGPRAGPPGRTGAMVAIVCEDLRNGGVLGVTRGIREAAETIGWKILIYDTGGSPEGRKKAMQAMSASPLEGVIIVGADLRQFDKELERLTDRGVPMVGWHVTPTAGAMTVGPVSMNVSTDPLEVARVTAMATIEPGRKQIGVVIFTDSSFEIATTKTNVMAEIVRKCANCTLLEIQDIAISSAGDTMPEVTRTLLASYGTRWTHALAINDIYFDYAVPELIKSGRAGDSIKLLSAGDGSAAAFLRIRAGAYQTVTVAEPLNLHGWQLVDELNRLMAGESVTGHLIAAHMVTKDNIAYDGGPQLVYDPDNGYRDVYRQIWRH